MMRDFSFLYYQIRNILKSLKIFFSNTDGLHNELEKIDSTSVHNKIVGVPELSNKINQKKHKDGEALKDCI